MKRAAPSTKQYGVTVLKPGGIPMLPCRFIAAYFCCDIRALDSKDVLPMATIKTTGASLRMTCSLALDSSGGQRQGAESGITVAAQEIV